MKKSNPNHPENIKYEWPEMPELFKAFDIIEYKDGRRITQEVIYKAISIRGERWEATEPMRKLDDMESVHSSIVGDGK